VIIGRGNFERCIMNIKWDDKKLLAKLDSENRSHIRTINNLIEHMDDGGYVSQLQAELAAVKAEQNHQNKGVMDLQDKYDKVVADRDRLKALLKKYVPLHYHDHDYWHDDCGLCQSEKEIYSDVKQALESDGE